MNCINCTHWIVKDEHDKKMAQLGFRQCELGVNGHYLPRHHDCNQPYFSLLPPEKIAERIAKEHTNT